MDRWYTIREFALASYGEGMTVKQYGLEQEARFTSEQAVVDELDRQERQLAELGSGIRLEVIEHRVINFPGS